MSQSPIPVLISGAGPSGLYLALTLTRNGVPVRIIEKNAEFHNSSRGAGIQPRTREIQHLLGVEEQILNWGGGTETPAMALYKMPGGTEIAHVLRVIEETTPTPDRPYGRGIIIPQNQHERVLREELAKHGVHVELGKELKSFTQDEDGVTISLLVHAKDGEPDRHETVLAEFLCSSDGAKGPTRKLIGATFLGETQDGDALVVADLVINGLDEGHWHMWRNAVGLPSISVRPFEDGKNTFSMTVMGFGGSVDPEEVMKPGGVIKAFRESVGRSDLDLQEPISVSYFRPNIRMADKFQEGRVFLLGDAAHVHTPAGGQGLNSSAHDAVNLGWKLALVLKKHSPHSLLRSYTEERLPVIKQMLQKTTGLYAETRDQTDDEGKLSAGTFFRGEALFQLGVNYRWSSLVIEGRATTVEQGLVLKEEMMESAYGGDGTTLLAGDRAPDAPGLVNVKSSEKTRFFDLFNITKHTVLIFAPSTTALDNLGQILSVLASLPVALVQTMLVLTTIAGAPGEVDHILIDTEGHAFSSYRVTDTDTDLTVVVVRPDTYIGAIVRSAEDLRIYFTPIFSST